MHDEELLDDWRPWTSREERKYAATLDPVPGDVVRADPISMLFDGPPPPVIVREEEGLALQRPPSGRLALNLLAWFCGAIGLLVLLYQVWLYRQ